VRGGAGGEADAAYGGRLLGECDRGPDNDTCACGANGGERDGPHDVEGEAGGVVGLTVSNQQEAREAAGEASYGLTRKGDDQQGDERQSDREQGGLN
jgi:hypothetical protein